MASIVLRWGLLAAGLVWGTACSSSDCTFCGGSAGSKGPDGGRREPTGSTSGGTFTVSAGSSGGAGSSGTGSPGSGTGNRYGGVQLDDAGCPVLGTQPPLTECDAGIEVEWNLIDFCTGERVTGATAVVSSILTSPPNPLDVDRCGYFHACVDPGASVAFRVHAPGFLDSQTAVIAPRFGEEVPAVPGLYLYCDQVLSEASALPGFDPTRATLAITVFHLDPEPDGGCGDLSGWSFWLTDVDGGLVDAGEAITGGLGIVPQPFTTAQGSALLYDLPPSARDVIVHGRKVDGGLPDGGLRCPWRGTESPFQLSGIVKPLQGGFTYVPYVVP